MRCQRIFQLACFVALSIALRTASAQSQTPSQFATRYDGVRLLFSDQGFRLGTRLEFLRAKNDDWSKWIIVVMGDPPELAIDFDRFVRGGGSLLFAMDQPSWGMFAGNAAWFVGGPMTVPDGPDAYRGVVDCPRITQWNRNHPFAGPLLDGVHELATNRPGYLSGQFMELWTLAYLPLNVQLGGVPLNGPATFIAAGFYERGRIMLVADQNLFANEMILELDNLFFTFNAIEWLRAGRRPQDLKVLFLDGGSEKEWVDDRFLSGEWKAPSWNEFFDLINEVVNGLEDESVADQWIAETDSRIDYDELIGALLYFATGILLTVLCVLMLRSRRRPDPLISIENSAPTASTILEQRRLEIVSSGNFIEPARQLIRQFAARTFPLLLSAVPLTHEDVFIDGGMLYRRRIRKKIHQLQQLALDAKNKFIDQSSFRQLQDDMVLLEQMIRDGTLRLQPDRQRESEMGSST